MNSKESNNEFTTIGCLTETADVFNEIKSEISDEIKTFYTPRIKKQEITLQCLIRCWNKSAQEIKDSIIHNIIKELKAND